MQQKIISYNFFILIIGLFICLLVPLSANSKTELTEMEVKEKQEKQKFERMKTMSLEKLKEFALFHLETGKKTQGIGIYEYFSEVIERDIEGKRGCDLGLKNFKDEFFENASKKGLFSENVNVLSYFILCNFRLGEFDEGVKLDLEIELYLNENASKINDNVAFTQYYGLIESFAFLENRLEGITKEYALKRQLDYLVWAYTRALNWGNEDIVSGIIVKGLQVSLRAKRLDKAKLYIIELDKLNKKQGEGKYDNMLANFKQKISEVESNQKLIKNKVEGVE